MDGQDDFEICGESDNEWSDQRVSKSYIDTFKFATFPNADQRQQKARSSSTKTIAMVSLQNEMKYYSTYSIISC